jgi:hypothetical protein
MIKNSKGDCEIANIIGAFIATEIPNSFSLSTASYLIRMEAFIKQRFFYNFIHPGSYHIKIVYCHLLFITNWLELILYPVSFFILIQVLFSSLGRQYHLLLDHDFFEIDELPVLYLHQKYRLYLSCHNQGK